ncbi:hypothetical protein [Perlucidibaca piscinae]|uniref:hypothetical protein n=1 Tax=Perlucidibaca piscinae TaxID=392589 RepID=UPI0012EC3150|nr:hypothetical protein [Perlucidibaca piscinae]
MDAAIWGLLGTIVGALASIATSWIGGRHAFGLQRQVASEEQKERHRAFQRETLIKLQEALHDSLRMMTRAHLEDAASFKTSGNSQTSILSEDVNEGVRVAGRRLIILIQRVANDDLRSDLKAIAENMARVVMAKSQREADAALADVYQAGERVMEHIGAVLRGYYESK